MTARTGRFPASVSIPEGIILGNAQNNSTDPCCEGKRPKTPFQPEFLCYCTASMGASPGCSPARPTPWNPFFDRTSCHFVRAGGGVARPAPLPAPVDRLRGQRVVALCFAGLLASLHSTLGGALFVLVGLRMGLGPFTGRANPSEGHAHEAPCGAS